MHAHTVLVSVNHPDGTVCVDIFHREDGTFGFGLFRRDPEDPRGWYPLEHHEHQRFPSEPEARAAARAAIPWLADTDMAD